MFFWKEPIPNPDCYPPFYRETDPSVHLKNRLNYFLFYADLLAENTYAQAKTILQTFLFSRRYCIR